MASLPFRRLRGALVAAAILAGCGAPSPAQMGTDHDSGVGGGGGIDPGPSCDLQGPPPGMTVVWNERLSAASWTERKGGDPPAIALTPGGDVILAGPVGDPPVDLGGGPLAKEVGATFVASLSPEGALQWVRQLDAAGTVGVALDPAGDIVVAVSKSGKSDSPQTPDGVVITRLDATGNPLWTWSKTWAPYTVTLGALPPAVSPIDGSIAYAGWFQAGFDADGHAIAPSGAGAQSFVLVLDAAGTIRWLADVAYPDEHGGVMAVAFDVEGNLVVAGSASHDEEAPGCNHDEYDCTSTFPSLVVDKLDPTGAPVWRRVLGNAGASDHAGFLVPTGLAVNATNDIVVAGRAAFPVDFGTGTITPPSSMSAFVLGLTPEGDTDLASMFGQDVESVAGVGFDGADDPVIVGSENPVPGANEHTATLFTATVDRSAQQAQIGDACGYFDYSGFAVDRSRGRVVIAGQFADATFLGDGPSINNGSVFFVADLGL